MQRIPLIFILFSILLPGTLRGQVVEAAGMQDPAEKIIESIEDIRLRLLLSDVLSRNPRLAVLNARARAAEQEPARVRALPNPMLSAAIFLSEPQTRVGPQRGSMTLTQGFPGSGKRDLREQSALFDAVALRAEIAAERLRLLTRVRSLFYELEYLRSEREILHGDIRTLERFEEMTRARYASGTGTTQAVIKIQAEITRTHSRILGLDRFISDLIEEINTLRDLPGHTEIRTTGVSSMPKTLPTLVELHEYAVSRRPEITASRALIDAAGSRSELAAKASRPDFVVGLRYSLIGRRNDNAGKANPPEGNGRDVLGLIGGISLPVWKKALDAEAEGAIQQRIAAEYGLREKITSIDGELSAFSRKIPLILEQLALFENTLRPQAEASLVAAENAYASATASALDLLDAERTLLRVRISTERTRSDLRVALAGLEGAAATSLEVNDSAHLEDAS